MLEIPGCDEVLRLKFAERIVVGETHETIGEQQVAGSDIKNERPITQALHLLLVVIIRIHALAPGLFGPHELWHLAVLAGMGLHWAFLFRNAGRVIVADDKVEVRVRKTGFEQLITVLARDYSLFYGTMAVLVSLLLGWFAGYIFQRV